MPNLVQKRIELEQLHERLNGLIFDVEYSADALKNLAKSNEHLDVSRCETFVFAV